MNWISCQHLISLVPGPSPTVVNDLLIKKSSARSRLVIANIFWADGFKTIFQLLIWIFLCSRTRFVFIFLPTLRLLSFTLPHCCLFPEPIAAPSCLDIPFPITALLQVKNLDTGAEMDLQTAEEQLPQSINPLSLQIMRWSHSQMCKVILCSVGLTSAGNMKKQCWKKGKSCVRSVTHVSPVPLV